MNRSRIPEGYGARVGVMGVVAEPDEPSFDNDTAMEALIPIVTVWSGRE